MSATAAGVLLVHGAWHGSWCWEEVITILRDRGIVVSAVDLPSCGETGEGLGDLSSDVATVNAALDRIGGSAVLCGHSYGGAVITAAGLHPTVRHLVYLAAVLPDEQQPALVGFGTGLPDWVMPPLGNAIPIRRERARDVFFADCDQERAGWAAERVAGAISLAAGTQAPGVAAWRSRPSTYVVCTEDRAVPAEHQRRMAARATHVVEWPCGHSPFLSQPDRVADLLSELSVTAGRHEQPA